MIYEWRKLDVLFRIAGDVILYIGKYFILQICTNPTESKSAFQSPKVVVSDG